MILNSKAGTDCRNFLVVWRNLMMGKFVGLMTMAGGALVAAAPAYAGTPVAPAPMVAAGIPALLAIGAGYLMARKRRGG